MALDVFHSKKDLEYSLIVGHSSRARYSGISDSFKLSLQGGL